MVSVIVMVVQYSSPVTDWDHIVNKEFYMLSSILEIALIAQQFDLLEPVLNFGSSILETGSSALASAV